METKYTNVALLRSHRNRIGAIIGNPPTMSITKYVERAVEAQLKKDEAKP